MPLCRHLRPSLPRFPRRTADAARQRSVVFWSEKHISWLSGLSATGAASVGRTRHRSLVGLRRTRLVTAAPGYENMSPLFLRRCPGRASAETGPFGGSSRSSARNVGATFSAPTRGRERPARELQSRFNERRQRRRLKRIPQRVRHDLLVECRSSSDVLRMLIVDGDAPGSVRSSISSIPNDRPPSRWKRRVHCSDRPITSGPPRRGGPRRPRIHAPDIATTTRMTTTNRD